MMLHRAAPPAPTFPTRSRLALVRDLAIITVCVALVAGFLAQLWSAPPPAQVRTAAALVDAR
jgi:hypothetical protein